jgi:hypothetical protein
MAVARGMLARRWVGVSIPWVAGCAEWGSTHCAMVPQASAGGEIDFSSAPLSLPKDWNTGVCVCPFTGHIHPPLLLPT